MKRKIIIISILTVVLLPIVLGVIYFTNRPKNNSTPTKSYIYIQKDLEKDAKIIKPAVEAYASQDRSETIASRNERLSKYFTDDSPVYEYELKNISKSIKKSSASVSSIATAPRDSDSSSNSTAKKMSVIIVNTKIIYSFNDSSIYESSQKYWASYKTEADGQIKIYDIGLY